VSETEEPTTAEAPAQAAPATARDDAPTAGNERGERKVRTGVVVSEKMDKTVLVRIQQVVRHSSYGKTVRRSSKLAAHDEANDAHVGDTVRLMETRPLSKTKRWRVVEIVERAK
jgi:small subunit ribosomal protein S17